MVNPLKVQVFFHIVIDIFHVLYNITYFNTRVLFPSTKNLENSMRIISYYVGSSLQK